MSENSGSSTVGHVAVQQALVCHFGLSYRRAAALSGASARTVWDHVAALPGANVAAWENRTEEQRQAAIQAAQTLIDAPSPGVGRRALWAHEYAPLPKGEQ